MGLATGTVAFYKFNNNGTDESGTHNLANVGTPVYSTTAHEGTHSVGPNTTTNHLQDVTSLRSSFFTGDLKTWSWEAWVYPVTSIGVLDSICGFSGTNNPCFNIRSDGRFSWYSGVSSLFTATGLVIADTWTHLAAASDSGTDAFKLYVNGTERASDSATTYVVQGGGTTVKVGIRNAVPASDFGGYIDEMRFMTTYETVFPIADPSGNPMPLMRRRRGR